MKNKLHSFPIHKMTASQKKITQYIGIVVLVIVFAGIIFYFNTQDSRLKNSDIDLMVQTETEEVATINDGDLEYKPEFIDLGMVEEDLNLTDKNLDTVDNLDNL